MMMIMTSPLWPFKPHNNKCMLSLMDASLLVLSRNLLIKPNTSIMTCRPTCEYIMSNKNNNHMMCICTTV